MGKEYWLHCYEVALEDIAEEMNLGFEEAEVELQRLLDENPGYLNGYLSGDIKEAYVST